MIWCYWLGKTLIESISPHTAHILQTFVQRVAHRLGDRLSSYLGQGSGLSCSALQHSLSACSHASS